MSRYAIFSGHSQLKNGSYTGSCGNVSKGELNETIENENVARAVHKWLKIGGAESDLFIIPRKHLSSKSQEASYKLPKANAKNYDCVFEIHFNAYKGEDCKKGTECVYLGSKSKVYAQKVNDRLDNIFKDREVKTDTRGLYMIRKVDHPSVIVEVCFCDSLADCQTYKKYGADYIGKLIAEGILNKDIKGQTTNKPQQEAKPPSKPTTPNTGSFLVKVTASVLNVRKGAGTQYPVTTKVKKGDVFTIVETKNNWGKLKSGAGWISLNYTTRV